MQNTMIAENCDNKEIIKNLCSLLNDINFRVNAFNEIEKTDLDEKTRELIQDLIVYDIKTVMDDIGCVFPFR